MNDIGASVIARLKLRAAKEGLQLQLLLNLFCQEEFLRRISISRFNENLILKGGLLLYTISEFASRPTMDADYLLKDYSNEMNDVEKMVEEIISVNTGNEFVNISIEKIETIAEHREYNGIRISLVGKIKNTRTPFCIDYGVGDIVVPAPSKRCLPVLLPEFNAPEVLTYSMESIISEKFDAIITRMELSGRMKDFFDIYYLATISDFEGKKIQEALRETLSTRETPYGNESLELLLGLSNDKDMMIRWNSFCKKVLKTDLNFNVVLEMIVSFLKPPYDAMIKGEIWEGIWNAESKSYQFTGVL